MDPTLINAILQKRGAESSPENINAVIQFAAQNPDVLERFAMGSGGQFEDNSALLQLALDKGISQTSSPDQIAQLIAQNQLPAANGNGAPPATRAPMPQNKTYPNPNEASGSPLQTGGIPGDFNAPAGSKPVLSGMVNEQGMPVEYDTRGAVTGGALDWLLPALGISSATGSSAIAAGRGAGAGGTAVLPTSRQMPTPDALQNAKGQSVPVGANGWPAGTERFAEQPQARGRGAGAGRAVSGPTTSSPEEIARLKAEVDAENTQARALQEQIAARQGAQNSTAKTLKAGARAIRGR